MITEQKKKELLTHQPTGRPQLWFTRKEVEAIIASVEKECAPFSTDSEIISALRWGVDPRTQDL